MLITGQTGFRTVLLKLGLPGAAIAPSSHPRAPRRSKTDFSRPASEANTNTQKTMKQIFTSLRMLCAITLLALAAGCASTQSTENMLVAAGFKVVTPKTATQEEKLKALPPGKVTSVQKSGKTYYVFPDAANNQAYVGGPKQYEAYRQLRMKQQLANEKLEAAEMNLEASQMDWYGWGGWGAWGPAWY
jgi:hypothetical protein